MRLGRYFVPGQPLHVIQRGNNRGRVFFTRQDASDFLSWLKDSADRFALAVHAYVLMPNHLHLLVTPATPDSLPKTMQSVGRKYVRHINRRHSRTGSLWEGRYRATVIDAEAYFFRCSRYIEMNPVRAALASDPGAYLWSSYRANAMGMRDPLVAVHPLYETLGATAEARMAAYRAMFTDGLAEPELKAIRDATHRGWALGDEAFQERIGAAAGRRARPLGKGRIKKPKTAVQDQPFA